MRNDSLKAILSILLFVAILSSVLGLYLSGTADGKLCAGSSDFKVYTFADLYNLTITAADGGTTDPEPGMYAYIENTIVTVTAMPFTGYGFDHWELNESSFYVNPINVTMDSNYVLNAVFNHNVTIEAFCITENVTLSLNITMDNSPTNFSTPHMFTLVGTHNFTVPDMDPEGHFFEQWSTGETNTTITVSSPPTLTAFYKKKWWLTIEAASGGTTDPSPGKEKYFDGTEVDVTALPSIGYLLDHWVLDTYDAGSSNPISVTMDADHDLQPVFSWKGICNLTITVTAGGNTTPSPGIHEYTNGTLADVAALSDAGYGLHHWELDGIDIGSENPIEVTMDENHTLNAVFRAIYYLTITATTGGKTDPVAGVHPYWEGSVVEVNGTANTGYGLHHWELDGIDIGSENPIEVTMDENHTLNAVFRAIYSLTITTNSWGTTNPAPGSYSYWEGSLPVVTATAYTGYGFDHWTLDGSWNYSNPITVKMDAHRILHAVFSYNITILARCVTPINVGITMDSSPTGFATPHTFTGLAGTHTFTVPETGPGGSSFLAWTWGSAASLNYVMWNTDITVNKNGTFEAYYYVSGPGHLGKRVGGTYYAVDITVLLASHILVTLILLVATMVTGMRIKHLRRREQSK